MNKKLIIFALVILMIVIGLCFCLVRLSIARSNETISRVDRHIEEVLGSD